MIWNLTINSLVLYFIDDIRCSISRFLCSICWPLYDINNLVTDPNGIGKKIVLNKALVFLIIRLWANFRPIWLYSWIISCKIKNTIGTKRMNKKTNKVRWNITQKALKWLNKRKSTTNVGELRCSRRVIKCSLIKGLYSTAH
jgi:hypothetical protein